MTNAYQVSQAIHVAVTLGIADLSRLRFTPGFLARSVDLQGDNNSSLSTRRTHHKQKDHNDRGRCRERPGARAFQIARRSRTTSGTFMVTSISKSSFG